MPVVPAAHDDGRVVGFASCSIAWQHEGAWLSRLALAPRMRVSLARCVVA
jgi:hypothetical protein